MRRKSVTTIYFGQGRIFIGCVRRILSILKGELADIRVESIIVSIFIDGNLSCERYLNKIRDPVVQTNNPTKQILVSEWGQQPCML